MHDIPKSSICGASWGAAETVAEANGMAVLRMLEELIRFRDRHGWAPRFFQPSSSEMFGVTDQQPQTENTPHHPRSPYAATKSFAHHLTVNYRESYGLFTATGTLYNHESPLRPPHFVTRKISATVAAISLGQAESVTLGNLDVRRDWGFAGDYARAMHLVLQQDEPGDFIIATGVSRSLADVLELAFASVGISDLESVVRQDPSLMPVTNKKAFSISIMIWVTAPPPNRPAAPYASPMSPEATAAKRSAASGSRPFETAIGKPSADTTTASLTPGMWPTKCSTSQFTLRAAALRSVIGFVLLG